MVLIPYGFVLFLASLGGNRSKELFLWVQNKLSDAPVMYLDGLWEAFFRYLQAISTMKLKMYSLKLGWLTLAK